MNKTSILHSFLFICVFIAACSQNKTIKKVMSFNDNRIIKISIKPVKKPTTSQQEKFNQASQLVNRYLNSQVFKTLVLKGPKQLNYIKPNEPQTNPCNQQGRASYTYNTVKGKCFNNQEIYQLIKSADWKLNVKIKPSWAFLNCKRVWNNAIGGLEDDVIVTPACEFEAMSVELLAGFLIHEYLHVIGFKHPYQASPNRRNTIPYFIGDNAIRAFIRQRG